MIGLFEYTGQLMRDNVDRNITERNQVVVALYLYKGKTAIEISKILPLISLDIITAIIEDFKRR